MSFFDIDKDALRNLSDERLEELVARLAEAEVASYGHSPGRVRWSGSVNASDNGIDVLVDTPTVLVNVPTQRLDTGFLARSKTILQVKKPAMPKSKIIKEMQSDGYLSPTISKQAARGGSYIIVSLGDDCAPSMRESRLDAMRKAVSSDPNCEKIHLDFIDRSRLLQWLRQHPAVMLWARDVLGQPLSGWHPHGNWSNVPVGKNDSLIIEPRIYITMPNMPVDSNNGLSIEDAIGEMRNLVRSTRKAIRVVGLSGVGKTRIVQALFEEEVGENALDKTVAIYADIGSGATPSATEMLERLIVEDRKAILVLDNCPSDIHSDLASKLAATGTHKISVITIEYDIREDKPQMTEVVHIEAKESTLAKKLLLRRYPNIGPINAEKIAELAKGNARMSLAIAERMEEEDSLSNLPETNLFDRLFEQRNKANDNLREDAQVLALVYSFSTSPNKNDIDELAVLGSIFNRSRQQLYQSASILLDRHIAQARGEWQAILPQPIANRLAEEALRKIHVEDVRNIFEAPGNERLLRSFAHRLGFLHADSKAQQIVEAWFQESGLLGRSSNINGDNITILEYVAPVMPDLVLNRIETMIDAGGFNTIGQIYDPPQSTIVRLLHALAFDAEKFARCIHLLIKVADSGEKSNNFDSIQERIVRFFQPYFSGTHATLPQKLPIVREALLSKDAKNRSLGFRMLSSALEDRFVANTGELGARPRDFGFRLSRDDLIEWRVQFIDLAVKMGLHENSELADSVRSILAKHLERLWRDSTVQEKLIEAAKSLNDHKYWTDGWLATCSIIYHEYEQAKSNGETHKISENIEILKHELAPKNLMANIQAYVLKEIHDFWELSKIFNIHGSFQEIEEALSKKAEQFGKEFTKLDQPVSTLGPNLFSTKHMPRRMPFGKGLALATSNRKAIWKQLVDTLHRYEPKQFNTDIICGYIDGINCLDQDLAQELLNECLEDNLLRQAIVWLHPISSFGKSDLERCIAALRYKEVSPAMYQVLLWHKAYANIPHNLLLELATLLLKKPHGNRVILEGLSMNLHGIASNKDILGSELRKIGLEAAIIQLIGGHKEPDPRNEYSIEKVVEYSLGFDDNEEIKDTWLNVIFSVIGTESHIPYHLHNIIQITTSKLPQKFLDRIFSIDNKPEYACKHFIEPESFDIMDKFPLARVDTDILIKWCQEHNNSDVWQYIAKGIRLWIKDRKNDSVSVADGAIKFLESAPNKDIVLTEYVNRIRPVIWHNDGTDTIRSRTDAFLTFCKNSNAEIAILAKEKSEFFPKLIDAWRNSERQFDSNNRSDSNNFWEQKFE